MTRRQQLDRLLFNLLPGEREKIRAFQGGKDPITGQPLIAAAHLDHDHETGLCRGLLNPMTNRYLIDNVEKLKRMLAYIIDPPAPKALGEPVYGLIGKAKLKKVMKYGPYGGRVPHKRSVEM